MMAMRSAVVLVTSDGQRFEVPLPVVRMLRTLDTMLEHLGYENDEPVPLPNVTARALGKVLSWAHHHVEEQKQAKGSPPPSPSSGPLILRPPTQPRVPQRRVEMPLLHQPSPWEEEFLKQLTKDDIHELLLAANYLDVKGLMDILCHTVANMIRGKDPQQIRRTFRAHDPSTNTPAPADTNT